MDKYHFLPLPFNPSPSMTWQSYPPVPELNCSPEQQPLDCFFNPNWVQNNSVLSSISSQNFPIIEKNITNLVEKQMVMNPNLPSVISADPGLAERAAKFSCFGSRSFNDRTSQFGTKTTEINQFKSSKSIIGNNVKLARVSSSPALRVLSGSVMGNYLENKNCTKNRVGIRPTNTKFGEVIASPNEGSSVSEQIPVAETEAKTPADSSLRKRKSVSRGKSEKIVEVEENRKTKQCKSSESNGSGGKEEIKDEKNHNQKQDEANTEPYKDYIHVRARRGQATDSHSLAERVRREKISERMKLLQDLVPGCNKVTGKALMLDEIINYVQSLQHQVEFLSMKLSSVNSEDFNTNSLLSNNACHSNGYVPHSTYPLDSPASSSFEQTKQEISQTKSDLFNGFSCGDINLHIPLMEEFGEGFPQLSASYEDDLQSIVQMAYSQNPNTKPRFHSQSFLGSSETSPMRIEL